jgi:SAM-dependent methyltransferase
MQAHDGQDHAGELADAQQGHWQQTYQQHAHMYGNRPSAPAVYAAERIRTARARHVLELGTGHGRDALHFARSGFSVLATDFSSTGLTQLTEQAAAEGLSDKVTTLVHDVREPLPLPDASMDAAFAHMLLCMALSDQQIHTAVTEVSRVLRPGGTFVYTVRHTGDAHYGTGISHGDGIYEHGGFAVHFFDRRLVNDLASGWHLEDIHSFEEGELPRRLWRVTQTKPA